MPLHGPRPHVFAACVLVFAAAGPSLAQVTTTCTPQQLANGGCLDILTRLPSSELGPWPVLALDDDEYVVADVATDGAMPASVTTPPVLPHVPTPTGSAPDVYVAKFTTADAVAQWVLPITASSIHKLLRGPGGRIAVVATTRSPAWPMPPGQAQALWPEWRLVIGVVSPEGMMERVVVPSFAALASADVIAFDSAGNLITLEAGTLTRRAPDTLAVLQAVSHAGVMFPGADDGRPEVVSLEWSTERGVMLHVWRRDDFAEVRTVLVPGVRTVSDRVRVLGGAELHLTGVLRQGDDALQGCPSPYVRNGDETGVFVAWVAVGAADAPVVRCVGLWPGGASPQPRFLRDGRLVVSARGEMVTERAAVYDATVYRSDDGGKSWHLRNAGLGAGDVAAVVVDPDDPDMAYATLPTDVFTTSDGGVSWDGLEPLAPVTYSQVSLNPYVPGEAWVAGYSVGAWWLLRHDSTAPWWAVQASGTGGEPPLPMFFDPSAPGWLWSRAAGYVSRDAGRTWSEWNGAPPWGTRTGGGMLGGTPLGRRYGTDGTPRLLWAAGDMAWTRATGATGLALSVTVDPHRAERAFAVLDTARILATRNGGPTWDEIATPLRRPPIAAPRLAAASRSGDSATSLLLWSDEAPARRDARRVLFRSDDSGASWTPLTPCPRCTSYARADRVPDVIYGYGQQPPYRTYRWWNVGATAVDRIVHVPADDQEFVRRYPGLEGVISGFASETDADHDGLPNGWERQYGAAAADPGGDPDGDGLSNARELDAGSHPVGRYTYACAEAATTESFATRLDMFNPSPTEPARVLVRYGASFDVDARTLAIVPPGATRAVDLTNGQLRFAGGEHAMLVESDVPLAVTRTLSWGIGSNTRLGQHAGACASPSPTWYFAEGSTALDFELFYVLFNPSAVATTVTATFLRAPHAPVTRTYALPAGARATVWANLEAPFRDPGDLAAVFEADDGVPVVVERSMYRHAQGDATFGGGTSSHGTPALATSWWFAEGATGSVFDTYLLVANPSGTVAELDVTIADEAGVVSHSRHVVPALGRVSLRAADLGPSPAGSSFTTHLSVSNGVPVAAERVTWWSPDARVAWWRTPLAEGHVSGGATAPATRWMLAGGAPRLSRPVAWEGQAPASYVLVGKWSSAATAATLRVHFADASVLERDIALAAGARRVTIPLQEVFGVDAIDGRAFAVTLEAHDPSAQLVVDLSQYRSSTTWWSAGTSTSGVPLP